MSTVSKSTAKKSVLEVQPIAGHIGAEIKGVHLSSNLDAETVSAIKKALLKHKVVFFRGQGHIDDAEQEAFATLFGEPEAHPTVPIKEGSNYLFELDSEQGGRANSWHTDVTFIDTYPKASILRAVVVPEAGGDTVWANTAVAYQNLPSELRQLADQLWAVHTNDYDYGGRHPNRSQEDLERHRKVFASTVYETEHPVVRIHPETGERTLVLGHFVKKIKGLSSSDSNHLFSVLQDHVTRLENTVRWHWKAGDIAIWDNRATQHYAINDYGEKHRVMRRVTLVGEVPVSIDGQTSITYKKEE
ncbi:taurine dioxygenase [Priestia megaterium]|uniref:Alpha-ketoglutarate-dependent sulfate ester dioxygenase n=1 Tax=Priestia megaterium TaxID=1404 RepID=A0A3D8X0F3_PRIMG|nr:TauD/TfdA family dioxygenase [Priestia megaterium]MDH3171193.1 TauD/TfdA family dioxygenase [Priestia megaterium]RDZ13387.1 taurine dioxygenase [Priestia megaterium]